MSLLCAMWVYFSVVREIEMDVVISVPFAVLGASSGGR